MRETYIIISTLLRVIDKQTGREKSNRGDIKDGSFHFTRNSTTESMRNQEEGDETGIGCSTQDIARQQIMISKYKQHNLGHPK